MQLNQLDKSNYFRAMLLLSGKDKKISNEERTFIDMLGQKLGFEESFRRQAINSFFENDYIKNEPPQFSTPEIAKSFIRDGIKLIKTDPKLHQQEIDWLVKVAFVNGIDETFIYDELAKSENLRLTETEKQLEIDNYL
jgi:hypothetical protein